MYLCEGRIKFIKVISKTCKTRGKTSALLVPLQKSEYWGRELAACQTMRWSFCRHKNRREKIHVRQGYEKILIQDDLKVPTLQCCQLPWQQGFWRRNDIKKKKRGIFWMVLWKPLPKHPEHWKALSRNYTRCRLKHWSPRILVSVSAAPVTNYTILLDPFQALKEMLHSGGKMCSLLRPTWVLQW